jgi:hypothetical protein
MLKQAMKLVLLPAAAAVVVACGGGGGGGGQQATVLSGTAAVGAAVAAATVNVYDATGKLVGTGTTGADGNFSITLTENGKAPYVLKLVKDEITLHALHADAGNGVVNITPLSDGVVSMLSPTGSSSGLISALQEGATAPTAALIKERREVVSTALGGMMTAAGVKEDIFTTAFSTNGTGQDKLLDSVSVNSIADGETKKANLQLTFKVATDPESSDTEMPAINLSSTSSVADALTEKNRIGIVNPVDLPSNNAGALYTGLIANLNNCYKEAPDVRTNGTTTVTSPACKKVFLNNDPTQYLNYGQRLGATQQFAGLFTYPGEVTFKPVDKPYLAQDLMGVKRGDGVGRAIVAMSWVNEHGNRENIMLYATKYTLDGQEMLGLSGDRNTYGWSVNSHNQKREFPLKADRSLDYVTSSYLFSVRDVIVGGNSIVSYATITSPTGKKTIMASSPGGASRDLAICKFDEVVLDVNKVPQTPSNQSSGKYVCTGTAKAVTFAEKFVTPTETRKPSAITASGILRPLDNNGLRYTPDSATLSKFPSMGLWTITYTFTGGRQPVTQKTWSVARPMTVEELMGPNGPDAVMPRYTDATISALKALKVSQAGNLAACNPTNAACVAAESPIPAPSSGGFAFAWTTNSIVPVTSLWAAGRRNADNKSFISSYVGDANSALVPSWDDQQLVRSTTSSAQILCSKQSNSDTHCVNSVNTGAAGDYNAKSWMSYSELWGKDAEQRSMMRSYNWYLPTF